MFAAISTCLIVQAWLIFALEINWDEFFYLSQIYDYQRGELGKTLQVLHVHLLGWITLLPGNEADQITAGRFVMLAFLAGTCALIYSLARTFFGKAASAMAVLAFISAGPTIIHGASFRADPISVFFIMLALATLARGRASMGPALLAGASAAVAGMMTIKVGLYAPAFLGIACWRLREREQRPQVLKWLASTALVAAIGFALLYSLQLMVVERASNSASGALLGNAARAQFLEYGFLPRRAGILRAAILSPIQTILILAGAVGVLVEVAQSRGAGRCRLLAIAGCGGTLLCLFVYRNAFPYFFAFIIPPASLLVAWAIEWRSALKSRVGLAILSVAMVGYAALVAITWGERERPPQRQVIAAIHEIFPEPVIMIDHSHMIGSFPKRGFFMSTWGMANYRKRPPIFTDVLARETVPLLLLDSPRLAEAVGARQALPAPERLHEKDSNILRENYVGHWGPIWVAGKRLQPAGPSGEFEILIPGTYTLEGEALTVDGMQVLDGGTVELGRGKHGFAAVTQSARILRWGNHLPKPLGPEPEGPLFVGF